MQSNKRTSSRTNNRPCTGLAQTCATYWCMHSAHWGSHVILSLRAFINFWYSFNSGRKTMHYWKRFILDNHYEVMYHMVLCLWFNIYHNSIRCWGHASILVEIHVNEMVGMDLSVHSFQYCPIADGTAARGIYHSEKPIWFHLPSSMCTSVHMAKALEILPQN